MLDRNPDTLSHNLLHQDELRHWHAGRQTVRGGANSRVRFAIAVTAVFLASFLGTLNVPHTAFAAATPAFLSETHDALHSVANQSRIFASRIASAISHTPPLAPAPDGTLIPTYTFAPHAADSFRIQLAAASDAASSLSSYLVSLWHSLINGGSAAASNPESAAPAVSPVIRTTSATTTTRALSVTRDVRSPHIQSMPITQSVIEHTTSVIQPQTDAVSASFLAASLQSLKEDFLTRIAALATSGANTTAVVYQTIGQASRIDTLSGTTLTNIIVKGVSGLTAGDIPALAYLATSGGTITGDLTISGTLSAAALAVSSIASSGAIQAPYFTATSTTASTFPNLLATNGTTTNATSTNLAITGTASTSNFISINATTTNLFAASASTTNATSTTLFSTSAQFGSATTTNLFVTNASTTNATSTNLFSVLGHFTTGVIDTLTATLATITNLTATNLTATNATTTNATSTSLFSTNATIPQLSVGFLSATTSTATSTFAGGFLIGTNALAVTQVGTVGIGTLTPARSFDIFHTAANPQERLSYDATRYTELQTNAAGDFLIAPSSGLAEIAAGNLYICASGVCASPTTAVSGTGNLSVANRLIAGSLEEACPSGYIWIPGESKYGTLPGFCTMKYDASNNGSGVAVSVPGNAPWVNISQTSAIAQCQAIGTGYHLMSDQEWMTIADEAAALPINDIDAAAGLQLANGHSDNSPASALTAGTSATDPVVSGCNLMKPLSDASNAYVASSCEARGNGADGSTDADKGYYGTGNDFSQAYVSGAANKSQLRTKILPNGAVIWDMGGNVWQWTDATIYESNTAGASAGSEEPDAGSWTTSNWYQYTAITSYKGLNYIRPDITTWSSTNGIGQIYLQSGTPGYYAFIRGGNWSDGANDGVFTLYLHGAPSSTGSNLGFRCSR